jgi:hypothetical protein
MPVAPDARCVKLFVSRFARPRSPIVRRPRRFPMSLQALRRWIARHPLSWVLGLALALGGAQFAATAHEYTHVATAASPHDGAHATSSHGCPTCLLAAALGGAAPASTAIVLVAPQAATPIAVPAEHRFTPRVTLAYASRAPPAQPLLAA